MPECCVEVVVEIDDGVLLARRTNEPVEGEWFWPGGRLYKGETLKSAARRIAAGELGIDVDVHELLGVYSDVWESSAVGGNPSRHTVNTVFRVSPSEHDFEITLDDQHDDYRLLTDLDGDLHDGQVPTVLHEDVQTLLCSGNIDEIRYLERENADAVRTCA